MLTQLKIYGAVIGGVAFAGGALMFSQARDLKANYTLVEARITNVAVQCYIERRKKKVVEKDTDELAYMDCAIAPLVATEHGFDDSDIKQRANVTYSYQSPVDEKVYSGTYSRSGNVDTLVVGKTIQVHAHKMEADKSRTSKGNLFIDDTGS